MTLAISAGLLVCGAVYLLLRRELLRVILGFILLGHAVNLILMASGGSAGRTAPFGTFNDTSGVADPLPQAFVLTAIVIAFSITIFLLSLAITGKHDDDTVDEDTTDDETVDNGDSDVGGLPRTSLVGTVTDEERLA
ncbi:multisubunit sodium/proton antiporter MrpC subunit [Rhodoglobus vestalii]|uniref:Multisubunit sodium/proton antiporter MrpC subunit n=1 Tax=Rhodoglobus vestalii TaxID=193384 RepID=A0A8H2PXY9_9MICO|nr:cation:proton antiporter subunit C [Rhodoglobus vestalii]TQO20710.1 multisubunit sodium/proton antiporter MrpC subunit [Rhodoglobus vestalii]